MKKMVFAVKKTLALAVLPLALALPAFFAPVFAAEAPQEASSNTEGPSVSAQCAAVIHMDTGEVLFVKNGDERRAMASTTKIMTALLTLEEAAVENREVEITREMVLVEGSSMGLREGDRLTLRVRCLFNKPVEVCLRRKLLPRKRCVPETRRVH